MPSPNESLRRLRRKDQDGFWSEQLSSPLASDSTADINIVSSIKNKTKVHSLVIGLAFPWLRQALCDLESPTIILENSSDAELEALVEFIYKGKKNCSSKSAVEDLQNFMTSLGLNSTIAPIFSQNEGEKRPDTQDADEAFDSSDNEDKNAALQVALEENLSKASILNTTSIPPSDVKTELPSEKESPNKPKKPRAKRVLMAHLSEADLTCKICSKIFPALYKLKIHSLVHSTTAPFVCSFCGRAFNNKYKMRSHEKIRHIEAERSTDKESSVNNKAGTVNVRNFTCQKCGADCDSKQDLKDHNVRNHPSPRLSNLTCSNCQRVFRSLKTLNNHFDQTGCQKLKESILDSGESPTKGMSGKSMLKCDKCSVVCSSRKSFKIHGKTAHPEAGEVGLPYRCPVCNKSFLKQSYLEEHHNRFHATVKPFPCMFCPKRCATKQDLDRHLLSHRGDAAFQCSFCPRSFVHRASLRKHQIAHLGQKPYQCIPCKKSYGLLSVLKKHFLAHERKSDQTRLVIAPKGRKGCLTYIDYLPSKSLSSAFAREENSLDEEATMTTLAPAYPKMTELSQMEVVDEITDPNTFQDDTTNANSFSQPMQVQDSEAGKAQTECQPQVEDDDQFPYEIARQQLMASSNTTTNPGASRMDDLTESESIAMDILGLFSEQQDSPSQQQQIDKL